MDEHHQVVIIGAGISGLKAAIDLTANGIDCFILEARDRLGGRLNTVKSKSGIPMDLGASWFHDCLENPLLKKTIDKGNVSFYYDDGKAELFTKHGLVDPNRKLEPVAAEIHDYLREVCMAKCTPETDISVRQACYNYLTEKGYTLTKDQLDYAPQLVRYFEMWIGSSWDILSARSITDDEHFGRNALVTNGYMTFYHDELEELAALSHCTTEELIGTKIKLNQVVEMVQFDGSQIHVFVGAKAIRCDYLLCSVPLSVLKLMNPAETGCITWDPPLPTPIRSSLDKISFSALGKVFLEFRYCFWPKDTDRFLCIGDPDLEVTQSVLNEEPLVCSKSRTETWLDQDSVPDPHKYTVLFMNLQRAAGKPVLLALVSNPLTHYLESASEEQVWQVLKPLVQQISRKKVMLPLNNPVSIHKTNWTNDPFARGSYAGVTVGDDIETAIDRLVEAKDIFDGKGRVGFMGEAVIDRGTGCVHGAWLTGEREAHKVIKRVNKAKL